MLKSVAHLQETQDTESIQKNCCLLLNYLVWLHSEAYVLGCTGPVGFKELLNYLQLVSTSSTSFSLSL
jgi:hypothetical protein